jgi:hypothetical protein
MLGTLDFSDALLGCGNGDAAAIDGENCNWGRLGDLHRSQTASADAVGFSRDSTGLAAGYQRASADGRWVVGGGLQYDAASLGTSGSGSLTGSDVQAGVVIKRNLGNASAVSGSVVAGGGSYATTRAGSLTNGLVTSNGVAKIGYAAAHLRASHEFHRDASFVAPYVDVGTTRVSVGALNESGSGALNANLLAHAQTFTTAQSGLHLETATRLRDAVLKPSLDLSATQFVGSTQNAVSGTFAGAPAVAGYTLTNRVDRTLLRIAPALTIAQPNRLDIRVGGAYNVSSGSHGFSAFVQIGKKF